MIIWNWSLDSLLQVD